MHDFNQYVGLPYATRGRDREGVDCWGLVRLVYLEQFAIELPSFDDLYHSPNDPQIRELIARGREGWIPTDLATPGDVVVLRVAGGLSHVGVIVAPGEFLHVRAGSTATIERLGSNLWRNRVEGFYRYEDRFALEAPLIIAGKPHPLRSSRVDGMVPAGMSIGEIADFIRGATGTPGEFSRSAIITVDGETIPVDKWDLMRPAPGARVEYRAIAQGDIGKTLTQIGVIVGAALLAPIVAPYIAFLGLGAAASLGLATAAITGIGSLLVNAIFPVRTPSQKNENPVAQNLLQGGSNQATPYGAIPVVLGQYRFTAPLAAQNYVESDSSSSYLRAILCWGYGPLQISDIRMGETSVDTLEELEIETVSGVAGENLTRFNSLYGQDVSQEIVNVKLEAPRVVVTSWVRTAGVVVATCTAPHGFQVGYLVRWPLADQYFTVTAVTALTFSFAQAGPNASSTADQTTAGGPWTERTIAGECNRVTVTLHFPNGLRRMKIDGSSNIGDFSEQFYRGFVQVRQLDPNTLAPITAYGSVQDSFVAQTVNLPTAFFNATGDAALEAVYRWTVLSVDSYSRLIVRHGAFTTNPAADPSGDLLARLQAASFGLDTTYNRIPAIGAGEVELHRVCVFGNTVFSVVDQRAGAGFPIAGCALTMTGLSAAVAAGTFTRAASETIKIGATGEQYFKAKDAFTLNISFAVPSGRWQVRVNRASESDALSSGESFQHFHDCYFIAATGYNNARPVAPPAPLAMTALRVRASNQINGTAEGFAATAISIAKDWNSATSTWLERPTRNPASLFRHVLQHPANAQASTDAEIDLDALADWHSFCSTNGFMFDAVVLNTRSTLDLLRDIAAAGRASPTIRDGKWTVIIDRPRSVVAQAFTPHNSWGFEGVRVLPILPHAFRVAFVNSERGYQPDEMIVYNDGYSAANATLFESLTLPGTTTRAAVFKHARFHLAQIKLRPETYSLNADLEHLICNRGDLVKIAHDVPLWGILTGRIRARISSTVFLIDEVFDQAAGISYTIRIRASDGTFQTRTLTVAGVSTSGSTITVTASLTAAQASPGDLFMLGLLNSESVDAVVLNIEEMDNASARLTLVDYSPAVYNSDLEAVPAFNSQITKPPALLQDVIRQVPRVSTIVSDESTIQQLAAGGFAYRIQVAYTNPAGLPQQVKYVEGESAPLTGTTWTKARPVEVGSPVFFDNVREGDEYRLRLRYVTLDGRVGRWVDAPNHTVVGRATPPPPMAPATLTLARVVDVLNMTVSNGPGTPIDFETYEFRIGQVRLGATAGDDTPDAILAGTTDNFWTDPDCLIVRSPTGAASISLRSFPTPRFSTAGVVYRVACRMRDSAGKYSVSSALASITITRIT